MSKYFEATLKARNAKRPDDMLLAAIQEEREEVTTVTPIKEEPAVAATTPVSPSVPSVTPAPIANPSGDARLANCKKFSLPLQEISHIQFTNKDSLEPAEESYRALRTRLLRLRASQELRSIVITSAVQGEGKTLTSLNSALCFAQLHDMRVLLVDADIRSCGLSRAIKSLSGAGLADILSGQCKPEEAILATDHPNLYVLNSGTTTMPAAELFASAHWPSFIGWCNETFRLTIVDSPPVLNLSDVELISGACDGVLMVVRALQTKRKVLEKCVGQIDSKKLLGIVYNGAAVGSHYAYGYKAYGAGNSE